MGCFLLSVILLACFAFATAMHETCSSQHGLSYKNGASFESRKADGSHYSCHCFGSGCLRLTCSRRSGPTEAPPPVSDEDSITGEVPESEEAETEGTETPAIVIAPSVIPVVFQPETGPERVVVPVANGTCYDEESGRRFRRGESFIRITTDRIRKSCFCPSSGAARISCRVAGCKLPDPPRALTPSYNYIDGCFDPWNNREYRSGDTYHRIRSMDAENRVMGKYTCTCSNSMMRCSAVDIPCCNLETGEFVPKGERFMTIHAGRYKFECTCEGQRGRYSRCRNQDGRNPFGPGGTVLGQPGGTTYRPIGAGRGTVCRDQRGRRYDVNSIWYERRGVGRWRCQCTQRFSGSGRVIRKQCSQLS